MVTLGRRFGGRFHRSTVCMRSTKLSQSFLVVYIREAHPSDLWQIAINVRTATAESCVRNLVIRIPALVDEVKDGVEATYTGWPDRLYVIDYAGRVAYKSAPGRSVK